MAWVSQDKFNAAGKSIRCRLLRAQIIRGVALAKGDEVDLSPSEAQLLKGYDSVEWVPVEELPIAGSKAKR